MGWFKVIRSAHSNPLGLHSGHTRHRGPLGMHGVGEAPLGSLVCFLWPYGMLVGCTPPDSPRRGALTNSLPPRTGHVHHTGIVTLKRRRHLTPTSTIAVLLHDQVDLPGPR